MDSRSLLRNLSSVAAIAPGNQNAQRLESTLNPNYALV
jgi:hypothetical protein